jgi:hypothetical protein
MPTKKKRGVCCICGRKLIVDKLINVSYSLTDCRINHYTSYICHDCNKVHNLSTEKSHSTVFGVGKS